MRADIVMPGGIVPPGVSSDDDIVIRDARSAADIGAIRQLFKAYADSLDVDLCFQNFAQELAGLPGDYAPPRGVLLIAEQRGQAIGCVGLRPLPDEVQPIRVGEVKRLYVVPRARGSRTGRALMRVLIERAGPLGYRELKLDTLASMTSARALYASLGFRECAPYYHNPLPGTLYMAFALDAGGSDATLRAAGDEGHLIK